MNVIFSLAKEVKNKSATEAYRNDILNFAKVLSDPDVSGNDNVVLQNTFRNLTGSNLEGLNAKSLVSYTFSLFDFEVTICRHLLRSFLLFR